MPVLCVYLRLRSSHPPCFLLGAGLHVPSLKLHLPLSAAWQACTPGKVPAATGKRQTAQVRSQRSGKVKFSPGLYFSDFCTMDRMANASGIRTLPTGEQKFKF